MEFRQALPNLSWLKARVQDALFHPSGDWNPSTVPLPVCKYARSRRDKRFRGEAAWSVCAAEREKYYGFKAGVLMNSAGEGAKSSVVARSGQHRRARDLVAEVSPFNCCRQGAITENSTDRSPGEVST